MTWFSPGRVVLEVDHELTLKQLIMQDAEPLFSLIDRNRDHLSQNDQPTSANYPTIDCLFSSIAEPANPARLCMGIWSGQQITGTVNITPDKELADAEIGYYLGREFTGRGYATRSVRRVAEYGLNENHFNCVWARVVRGNLDSIKVLYRSGFLLNKGKCDTRHFYFEITRS